MIMTRRFTGLSRLAPRSLSARLALATALVVLAVVALAGTVLALRMDQRDRAEVDAVLAERATRVADDAGKLLGDTADLNGAGPDDEYGELLSGSDSLVRLLDDDGAVVAQRGATLTPEPPAPVADGYADIDVDGDPWRTYTVTTDGVRVQVLQTLVPVEARLADNVRLVALITLAAGALAGAGGWAVARLVVRPVGRLTAGATRIVADPDPAHRMPHVTGPLEVATLSETLNAMLDRIAAATDSTRRFTADVGHELRGPLTVVGAHLEILGAEAGSGNGADAGAGSGSGTDRLAPDQRAAVEAMTEQHARMTTLLSALQTLARGDAGALPGAEEIDVTVLVRETVRHAAQRHPQVTWKGPPDDRAGVGYDDVVVTGWRDGLQLALGNLLDNAALHGRPAGRVTVSVARSGETVAITVADDGPGVPAVERPVVTGRFVRGAQPRGPGSGLGLALVDQQARLHSGTFTLGDGPDGGLAATLTLRLT
ncbi:ATP-binding protein [Promicromonospora sp. Populi]|uniref:HAMP domain-containing sensor histidine kinase n=1 Tax=Promicromonospora sp. Populi TaxID=3239420 RepID=UPI0034E213F5